MDRKTAQNCIDEIVAILDHIKSFNGSAPVKLYSVANTVIGLEEIADALELTRSYRYISSGAPKPFFVVTVKYKGHILEEYQDAVGD